MTTYRVIIDGAISIETADQPILERQGNYITIIITVFSGKYNYI